MEWHWQIPIARYGDAWRQGRKLLDRGLRPGAAPMYRPMQQARAHVLLTRLLATPDQWRAHIELCELVSLSPRRYIMYSSYFFTGSKGSLF